MFAEYSEADEFVMQGQLELFAWKRNEDKSENERRRYRVIKSIPHRRVAREKAKQAWHRQYEKHKLASDPVWAARRRESKRLSMQRARARAA
jgi:hypothetical protein